MAVKPFPMTDDRGFPDLYSPFLKNLYGRQLSAYLSVALWTTCQEVLTVR